MISHTEPDPVRSVPRTGCLGRLFDTPIPSGRTKDAMDTGPRAVPHYGFCIDELYHDTRTHLFECIRTEMRKGSPEGYNAENGCSEPARKPQTGEPYERQPLYRIRCTQEKYQLLREDRRRDHRGRKHAASDAPGATGVGTEAAGAVARRDGSNAVQRMDLRYVETLRCRVANGTSGDDEGDRRIQEEERQAGRAENRGPGAVQSVASMLRGAERNPRAAADAALPQPSGGAGDAHAEQDERAAH